MLLVYLYALSADLSHCVLAVGHVAGFTRKMAVLDNWSFVLAVGQAEGIFASPGKQKRSWTFRTCPNQKNNETHPLTMRQQKSRPPAVNDNDNDNGLGPPWNPLGLRYSHLDALCLHNCRHVCRHLPTIAVRCHQAS